MSDTNAEVEHSLLLDPLRCCFRWECMGAIFDKLHTTFVKRYEQGGENSRFVVNADSTMSHYIVWCSKLEDTVMFSFTFFPFNTRHG